MQCTSVPFPGALILIRSLPICLTANNSALSVSTENSALCRGGCSGFKQHTTDIPNRKKLPEGEGCNALRYTAQVTKSIILVLKKRAFATDLFLSTRGLSKL